MKIRTIDGMVFSGKNPEAIVRRMRNEAWRWTDRKGKYMDEVIHNVETMTGYHYRVKLRGRVSAQRFLKFLLDAGMIEKVLDKHA